MHKFNSLQLVIELAETTREQMLADLQKFRKSHAYANSQMAQLEQYAAETQERWARNAQLGTAPELLRHHYQFMERLQQAIALQANVIAGSSRTVQLAEQKLLQAELRLASLKLVLTKRLNALDTQRQRLEQKVTDEFATLQFMKQRRSQMENSHGN